MIHPRNVLIGLLLVASTVPRAHAGTEAERWVLEFGPYAGHYDFDAQTFYEDFALFGLRLGVHMTSWLRMEASFDEVYTERSVSENRARQVSFNLHARVEPWSWRVAPFAVGGLAFVILDDADDPDAWGEAFDSGLGVRWLATPRWIVRGEWMLRRQNFDKWRAVEDGDGGTTLVRDPVTLWGRSVRVGVSYVF